MIFAIATFIKWFFPSLDISRIQRWVFWAVMLIAGVVVLFLVLQVRSCFSRPPKLDQKEIQKAQEAIAKEDRKVMIEVLTNSKVAEQEIESNIKAAEEATEAAKRDYSKLSNAELAAELERRLNE